MRRHPVDLLVLDMIMDPGIDGLETFRRINERSMNPSLGYASGEPGTRNHFYASTFHFFMLAVP